jgi:hypothetical protein
MLLLAKRALNHAPIVHFLSLHELELQVYWGLASFDHHFGYNWSPDGQYGWRLWDWLDLNVILELIADFDRLVN